MGDDQMRTDRCVARAMRPRAGTRLDAIVTQTPGFNTGAARRGTYDRALERPFPIERSREAV